MKKLSVLLMVVLLLAGCSKKQAAPQPTVGTTAPPAPTQAPAPPAPAPPAPSKPVTLYTPESTVEKQTGGAVRVYNLEADTYFKIANMGNHLLLMGQKGLTVITGDQGTVVAKLATADIRPDTAMDITAAGVAYYTSGNRKVTMLNPNLQVTASMELPEGIVNDPCISIARNEVFYSTGSELRAKNMTKGNSRLVRQQTASTQELLGAYFDGTILLCKITDADGDVSTEYISAETGQTIAQGHAEATLQTYAAKYIAMWQDNATWQTAFGIRGEIPQSLQVLQPGEDVRGGRAALPAMHAVVDYKMAEGGLELTVYDLNTGRRTARTVLPGVQSPVAFCGSGSDVSILATDGGKSAQALYRWNITKTAVTDETVLAAPLYTAENPDTEGLAECRKLADTYETQYGVKFLLWQDAVKITGGHTLSPEYQPQVIQEMLEKLQPVLAQFPEKFLQKTVEAGWIRIALVRDIAEGDDWVQFWEEGDCWIILSADTDVAASVLQGIAYGIDSHVLGNSREFDTWAELNPTDFTYTYGTAASGNTAYLSGENRAFVDQKSMTNPTEDRCRIFYYATLPERAEMFKSPVMQAKLLRICKGIREAYNLQKKTDTYIWEQYLETSLAYNSQK